MDPAENARRVEVHENLCFHSQFGSTFVPLNSPPTTVGLLELPGCSSTYIPTSDRTSALILVMHMFSSNWLTGLSPRPLPSPPSELQRTRRTAILTKSNLSVILSSHGSLGIVAMAFGGAKQRRRRLVARGKISSSEIKLLIYGGIRPVQLQHENHKPTPQNKLQRHQLFRRLSEEERAYATELYCSEVIQPREIRSIVTIGL